MPVSVFFDFFTEDSEQQQLQEMVQEAISTFGHDVWYVPRTVVNRDLVFTEPEYATYDSAFLIAIYFKTQLQMGGEGALMSKFGFELRDELVVTMAKLEFKEEILDRRPDILRPREGDLMYIPMIGSLFTIKYVDKKAFFYQLGDLQAYDLSLELYEAQSEVFNTGVPEIDAYYKAATMDELVTSLFTEDGNELHDERTDWPFEIERFDDTPELSFDQSKIFETEADAEIDWSEADPFSEKGHY